MELLFVTVIGASLSLGMRYLVAGRHTHGVLVVPSAGTAVTAAVWALCVWLGLPFDGGWIWVIALVAGPLAALAVAFVLPPRREAADAALLQRLMKPATAKA